MWAILNQLLLLLVITSPLVGIVVVALGFRWGAGRDAIREAVITNSWLTVALVGLVVVAFRVPHAPVGEEASERQRPAIQMNGSMRWLGDSASRAVMEDVRSPSHDATLSAKVLPAVRMAWGVDAIQLCFLTMTAILMIPMCLIHPPRPVDAASATDRKSEAQWYIGILGIGASTMAIVTAQDVVWLMAAVVGLVFLSACVIGEWGGIARRSAVSSVAVRLGMGSLAFGLALMGLVYALAWMQFWGGENSFGPNHLWQRIHMENLSRRFFDPVAGHLWQQMSPVIGLLFCIGAYFWLPIVPVHRSWTQWWSQSPAALRLFWISVGSQLGLFGLVEFVLPLFSPLSETAIQSCGAIGLSGFLYTLCLMSRQTTLVGAMSYGTLAQQGLCFAAMTCGERSALWGGLLQIVSFSLSSGVILWQRSMGSPIRNGWPRWTVEIATGSLCGVPGTLGFVSQLLILWGLFRSPVNGELFFLTLVSWVFSSSIWRRSLTLPLELQESDIPIAVGENVVNPQEPVSSCRGWSAFGYALIVAVILLGTGLRPALILDRLKPSTQHLALVQRETKIPQQEVTGERRAKGARHVPKIVNRERHP
ncbi:MAG: proton-conducting transporter membrane subunit [Planctomycetaceae bacterium]